MGTNPITATRDYAARGLGRDLTGNRKLRARYHALVLGMVAGSSEYGPGTRAVGHLWRALQMTPSQRMVFGSVTTRIGRIGR